MIITKDQPPSYESVTNPTAPETVEKPILPSSEKGLFDINQRK